MFIISIVKVEYRVGRLHSRNPLEIRGSKRDKISKMPVIVFRRRLVSMVTGDKKHRLQPKYELRTNNFFPV